MNRYNQVPHLTQDTNGKVTNSQQTPQTRAKRSALSQQVTCPGHVSYNLKERPKHDNSMYIDQSYVKIFCDLPNIMCALLSIDVSVLKTSLIGLRLMYLCQLQCFTEGVNLISEHLFK